jgi:hypothetical protein
MMADVQTIFSPSTDAMYQHLEHLFGGYLDGCHDGLIELAWTDTKPNADGRYKLNHARMFGTDQIDELVAEAARLNSQPMCNVYIGAALRKPGTFPGGRASDSDVLALTCGYVDLDDQEAAAGAKDRYGQGKPTMVVVTGREPYTRAQMWWRLSEPIMDQGASQALLKGMAVAMGGDTSVTDPPRVMRLAGTIAWPVKPGRKTELTAISPLKEPGRPVYSVEHLAGLFPPVVEAEVAGVVLPGGLVRGTNALGLPDKIADGRERYMTRTIGACLIQYVGETGAVPEAQELFDIAWPQYERNVDFTRAGRGAEEMALKCKYTIVRFQKGSIKGCETVDKTIALYRERERAREARPKPDEAVPAGSASLFEYLSVDQIKRMPDPEWLVSGLVVENALGFIYGPPGCLKTFIALDMALSFTVGMPDWWGRKIERGGAVVYISSEGQADLKFRIQAWEQHNKVLADDSPFYLIRQTINFMKPEDVGKLLATVQAIADLCEVPITAVFVDTVSRVLPGSDENLQKDMTLFVAACDAVRQRFGATVIGLHHTSRAGNIRGSTVLPGAGDFLLEVRREPGAMNGSVFATKIKSAEDGWEQFFRVEKLDLPGIVPQTSLVVTPSDTPPKEATDWWPSTAICREIITAIDEQWVAGEPWCFATNTTRSAIINIMNRWDLERDHVKQMLEKWNAKGVIKEEVFDTKNHVKGYRKIAGF